ncbi:MAG: tetratricopeptide repeat protein [Candidatus Hodarchaeota archaeon]
MESTQFPKIIDNRKINFNAQSRSRFPFLKMDLLLLFLLVIFGFIIYSSSIKGPFVFDDTFNIRDNPKIRLTKLTLDGLIKAGFESPCPNRPVANISFALNHYFNRYDVAGYHFVNILIHIITGIILFYFIKITLELLNFQGLAPQFEKHTPPDKRNNLNHSSINSSVFSSQHSFSPNSTEILFISFFSTSIWLVHPVQTQAVSYIVQRMNSMAVMFYILSLLFYVKTRHTNSKRKKLVLLLGCILSGILSLGSKEIALTLPLFIFLYEWYFFQEVSLKWLKRNSIYLLLFLFIVTLLLFFYLDGHPIERILYTYKHRDFNLLQRVFTEFRVVIFYISLLIFPHPARLNLLHDFSISNSFLDPITTILSFISIAGLMVTAIWLAKRERLLSFCILWFLGNLIIESSVIGLEIIFEHRVYLPSMFFILMLVSLLYRFVNLKWIWGALLCAVVVIFSIWTYQRNIVWSEDVKLWRDCVNKSPNKSRQHHNLGIALAQKGNLDDAIEHYRAALKIKPDYLEVLNNLGIAFVNKGDYDQAILSFKRLLKMDPNKTDTRMNLANVLFLQSKTDEAISQYRNMLQNDSENADVSYNLAYVLSTQGKLNEAVLLYKNTLRIDPKYSKAYYNLGNILLGQEKVKEATTLFISAIRFNPDYAQAYNKLGSILFRQGKLSKAKVLFSKAMKINPNYSEARTNLDIVQNSTLSK